MANLNNIDSLLSALREAGEEPPQWGTYSAKVKFLVDLTRRMKEDLPKKDLKQSKEDIYTIMETAVQMLFEVGYRVASRKLKLYVDKYKDLPEPKPEEEPEPEDAEKERLRK
jgi:hypothetical protein